MYIALLEGTLGVNIQIVNSIFHNNKANWGGGLCLYLQKYAHKNYILVFNSTFMKNHGNVGGGGVQVRLGEQENGLEKNNIILFKKVTFNHNTVDLEGEHPSMRCLLAMLLKLKASYSLLTVHGSIIMVRTVLLLTSHQPDFNSQIKDTCLFLFLRTLL